MFGAMSQSLESPCFLALGLFRFEWNRLDLVEKIGLGLKFDRGIWHAPQLEIAMTLNHFRFGGIATTSGSSV
jgi:hypothetical protein